MKNKYYLVPSIDPKRKQDLCQCGHLRRDHLFDTEDFRTGQCNICRFF
jgi:hypothetical protein